MIICNWEKCSGCNACVQVCPVKAIQVQCDNDGFRYPVVTEACIDCGRCRAVCHTYDEVHSRSSEAYAAFHKNNEERMLSTSGGVFSALADHVLLQGGTVFGCVLNDSFQAVHRSAGTHNELRDMRGSKYIQSDTGDTYSQVKKILQYKKPVLYTGTPCQVDGLLHYLGKQYDHLITADLVCHGVPSQLVFDKYIAWLGEKLGGKISRIAFRDKRANGWGLVGSVVYNKNGKEARKAIYPGNSYYYYYFAKGKIYRRCCYSCQYAQINRVADYTLGDFWGIEKIAPNIDSSKGVSLLLANSEKAKAMLKDLPLETFKVSIDMAIHGNQQLQRPVDSCAERDEILRQMVDGNTKDAVVAFRRHYMKDIIVNSIASRIPACMKRYLKQWM